MARYTITLDVRGTKTIVEKLRALGQSVGVNVTVNKVTVAESRADRLSEASGHVEDAKATVEELKDELQNWRDGLPENLSNGEKAQQLDEAISGLEDLSSNLEQCDFSSIEFPGMY